MSNLSDLLGSNGAGWSQLTAMQINDSGLIVGYGTIGGASHGFLAEPLPAPISGVLTLQDFTGAVASVPATLEFRVPGTTTVVETCPLALGSDGSFSLQVQLHGTYDIAVKASHWLRSVTQKVAIGPSGVSGLAFSLINGDVNGDDTINLADLIAISAAWRSTSGSLHWNPNADLNGDGVVNLADWLIVAKNWRKSGDP